MKRPTLVIPAPLLDTRIGGVRLSARTLREELGSSLTLLVFLRHFGCPFCRESVRDLRRARSEIQGCPPILYFTLGSPDETHEFFERFDHDARAVADPNKIFYGALGLGRATLRDFLSPALMRAGLRSVLKGNGVGRPVGDAWEMPGMFLVQNGFVEWSHVAKHSGDQPDLEAVVTRYKKLVELQTA